MNSKIKFLLIGILIGFVGLFLVITSSTDTTPKTSSSPSDIPVNVVDIEKFNLQESRSFYMGVGGFPYAETLDAVKETDQFVKMHGDISLAHFQDPPWNEEFNDEPYPNLGYLDSVNEKYKNARLFLMLGHSDNHGDKKKIAGEWADKNYDEPEVLDTYLEYCRFMINKFTPDYFAYSTEINRGYVDGEPGFEKVLDFNKQVYTKLKNEYPELPIFVTLTMTDDNIDNFNAMKTTYHRLLEHSDYIALSMYPYLPRSTGPFNGGDTNPDNLSDEWFKRMKALAPASLLQYQNQDILQRQLVI